MKRLMLSLILGIVACIPLQAQKVINDLELKGIHLEKCKAYEGYCLVFEAEGTYSRNDYPQMKIFINDALVAETGWLYGIGLRDGYEIETMLTELPDNFECLVAIQLLHRNKGDLFTYTHRATPHKKETEK